MKVLNRRQAIVNQKSSLSNVATQLDTAENNFLGRETARDDGPSINLDVLQAVSTHPDPPRVIKFLMYRKMTTTHQTSTAVSRQDKRNSSQTLG